MRAALLFLGLVAAVPDAHAGRHTLGVEWEFENFSVHSESKQNIEQAAKGEKCLLRTTQTVPSLGGSLPVLQITYDLPVGKKPHERRLEVVTGPLIICSSEWQDVVATMKTLSVQIDRTATLPQILVQLNKGKYTWEPCNDVELLKDLSVSTSTVTASTQDREVTAQTNFLMALEDMPLRYESFLAATEEERQYKAVGSIMEPLASVAEQLKLSPTEVGFLTLYAIFQMFGTAAAEIDVDKTHSQVKNVFEYFPKVMLHDLVKTAELDKDRIKAAMIELRKRLKKPSWSLPDDNFEALDRDFFSVDVVSNPVRPRKIDGQTFFLVESRGVRSALNVLWHGQLGATGYSLDLGSFKSFGRRGKTNTYLSHLTAPTLTPQVNLTSCQKDEEEQDNESSEN